MTSFKRLLGGILLMLTCTASASNFSCQVPANFQNLSCEGSVEVKNLTELIAYKNNLAMKKGKAKNLIVVFNKKRSNSSLLGWSRE